MLARVFCGFPKTKPLVHEWKKSSQRSALPTDIVLNFLPFKTRLGVLEALLSQKS